MIFFLTFLWMEKNTNKKDLFERKKFKKYTANFCTQNKKKVFSPFSKKNQRQKKKKK